MRPFILIMLMIATLAPSLAQSTLRPPFAPGLDAHWRSAAKNGFGTSATERSRVWFTLTDGVLSEVYYPTLDIPNIQELQLRILTDRLEFESTATLHRLEVLNPQALTFRQINQARNGDYTITKTYVTDPQRASVLIDVRIVSRVAAKIYVYYDPSLNNSGMHDSAWSQGDALLASDGDKASALICSSGFAPVKDGYHYKPGQAQNRGGFDISNEFAGGSGGRDLIVPSRGFVDYPRANNGNVVQIAQVGGIRNIQSAGAHFALALAFGRTAAEALQNARASIAKGFSRIRREYEAQWRAYNATLPRVEAKYRKQFNMAAMVLKGLEDKTYRGATIASPSIPWGGGANANEPTISGYHAVWSRDLYQVATALDAMGDRAGANRALDYLFRKQQKRDGSWPQNSWVDGRPIGGAVQIDEVALPLVLAYQLGRRDSALWLKHIKPAADFILRHGPATTQDRWEEKSGYSPATIAAEIAGLLCAAEIARTIGDSQSASAYLKTADDWAANVERWTATSNGPYGDGHYYLRISENDNPDDGAPIEINSGGGTYDERQIVDLGFLELVRLGIKSADDNLIRKSLSVADQRIKVDAPETVGWYRYDHDAYGEREDGGAYDGQKGIGRLWTLLTGERGEYEIALGDPQRARLRLDSLMEFANEGLMIPEQVWDRRASHSESFRVGQGTGSATPLAWSMAQFIRLTMNLKAGRNLETPDIVARRYALRGR